jgi:hypothetical protein
VAILRYNQNCWAFLFVLVLFFQLNLIFFNKEAPISVEFNVGIEVVFRKENATLLAAYPRTNGLEGKLDYLMLG